jgi:hypothetical protein
LQNNFTNFKLGKGLSKYRLIFISTLFLNCTVIAIFSTVSPEMVIKTNSHISGNETISKCEQNLEFKTNDSTPASPGLKVEIVPVSCPVSIDSGEYHLSSLNHLNKIYSKKQYSLISHSNLIISKTLHISPLLTKLQI